VSLAEPTTVVDRAGHRASLVELPARSGAGAATALVRLDDGTTLAVPAERLERRQDGVYYLSGSFADFPPGPASAAPDTVVLPVVEERLHARSRRLRKGGVRVSKHVHSRVQTVDEPGFREDVDVTRVPINRVLDAPVAIRQEGDTLVVPVMEEVVVVERRLVLKEELRITKRRQTVHNPQRVPLRSEDVTVERLPEQTSGDEQAR
jgi:uncharacterized protein (TIGR02271 family)